MSPDTDDISGRVKHIHTKVPTSVVMINVSSIFIGIYVIWYTESSDDVNDVNNCLILFKRIV